MSKAVLVLLAFVGLGACRGDAPLVDFVVVDSVPYRATTGFEPLPLMAGSC